MKDQETQNKNKNLKSGSMPFSFRTIRDFDEHIQRSIEGYDILECLIIPLASNFIKESSYIVDYGCSSGRMINNIAIRHPEARFFGFDITSHNFLEAKHLVPNVRLIRKDVLHLDEEYTHYISLNLFIFTLQFMEYSDRIAVLKQAYDSLEPGGAIFVAEKVYCNSSKMQDYFQFSHYDRKRLSFSAEEILNKQKDLRKIMRPLYEDDLINLFNDAGFKMRNIELFWASYNFRAYCLIKD